MEFDAKTRRHRKGEPHRNLHEFVDTCVIKGGDDNDARVLNKLFRIFMDVGAGGLNLILDNGLKEIEEAKAAKAAREKAGA